MDLLLRRYFWVVNLTVVALCSALVGRAASHVVEGTWLTVDDTRPVLHRPPPAQTKGHGKEIDDVVKRDLFCSACTNAVKEEKSASSPSGPTSNEPTKTSLQIELVSTMVVPDDPAWSMAVLRDLADKAHDAEMFNRGKKIFATKAVVKEVQLRRVYIDNEGKTEYIDLDDKAAPAPAAAVAAPKVPAENSELGDLDKSIQCNGNNCTIERALVDRALANTTALASMARFVPSVRDGKPNGFKVYAVRKGSLFDRLGMQNGDTLKAINGNEMSTPDQALGLYTKLRTASHLGLQVERRGETVNMDYTIK